jgi:membrane protein implicated in regulation of membrane protease activity
MSLFGLPPVWGWLGFGLALIAAEVVIAPGTYMLWIGLAALAMALITSLATLSLGTELALFGALALGSAMAGWVIYGRRAVNDAAQDLHDLSRTLRGQVVLLATAIENGNGQARVGDSVWRVNGPDLPAGAKVRILSVDGATLVVEAV